MNEYDEDVRPSPEWTTRELGEYAQHQAMEYGDAENTMSFSLFRLGQAIAVARARYPDHEHYRSFLKLYRLRPYLAERAQREYEDRIWLNFNEVEMLTASEFPADPNLEALSEAELVARLRELVLQIEKDKENDGLCLIDYEYRYRLREKFSPLFNRLIHGGTGK